MTGDDLAAPPAHAMRRRNSEMTGAPKPRDTRITEKAHHTALMAQAANFYRQRDFLITALKVVEQGTTSYNSVMKLFEVLWPGETAAPTKE